MTPKKRRKSSGPLTPIQRDRAKARFLDAFAQTAIMGAAANAAGVSRQTVYQWLEHDEEFSLLFAQAKEDAKDVVRAEIHRRAAEGWEEPVFQRGEEIGTIRKYSDTLLIVRAKALMPEEYRERLDISRSSEPVPKGYAGVGLEDL